MRSTCFITILILLSFIGCADKPSDSYIRTTATQYFLDANSALKDVPFTVAIESTWTDKQQLDTYWANVTLTIPQNNLASKSIRSVWRFVKQNNEWSGSFFSIIDSPEDIIHHNQDAIITDLSTLGADAYQFKIRPSDMGGGDGSYVGFKIMNTGAWGYGNPNAVYIIVKQTATQLIITATSKQVKGATVTVTFNENGNATTPAYEGF
jgi:hypothetical protein